ncbi:splicing factor Cactin [Spea bombifrons]|uniref:splicing factor Cactin n=1 Tax=Spea bombifrons TaxID=233779 RepID=UPI0023498D09|nr:splicing factor Cactin [Spea bombifrons]
MSPGSRSPPRKEKRSKKKKREKENNGKGRSPELSSNSDSERRKSRDGRWRQRHRSRSTSESPERTSHRRGSSDEGRAKRRHRSGSRSDASRMKRDHRPRSRSISESPERTSHRRGSSDEGRAKRRHRSGSRSDASRMKRDHRPRSRSISESPERTSHRRGSSDEGRAKRRHRSGSRSDASRTKRDHRPRLRSRSSSDRSSERMRSRARSSSQDSSVHGRRRGSRGRSRSDSAKRKHRKHRARSTDKEPKRHKNRSSSESDNEGSKKRHKKSRKSRSGTRCSVSSVSSLSPARSQSPVGQSERGLTLQERLQLKEEKKKKEEMMKAMETPEEKRARRLAKKEAKERKKREKMGWGEEYMGYTNTDNPFGDNNLLGTFIWNKALEKKGIGHLAEKDLKERNKSIQEDNRLELQKVKQLRLEREREKAMREQELEMLQREKEAEHFKTWEEQEDNFHLQQAKLRSTIRIRDARAKPIDLLGKYISAEDDDLAVEMHEPYTFLTGLTLSDLEDLLEDIQIYMELEQGKNVDFWRDMTIITEDEISKLRKLETSGKGPGERREGVNASVTADVQSVFKGKTYNQLQIISHGIENKIRAGGPNLDIGYWESLLQQLRAYMARARLRERHQDVLRQKLFKLKQEQGVESEPLFPIVKQESESPSNRRSQEESTTDQPGPSSVTTPPEESGDAPPEEAKGEGGESVLMEEDLIQQSLNDYDAGKYSPKLLTNQELPFDAHVVDFEEDQQRLVLCRQQLQVTGDASESPEDIFIRKAKEGMEGDEAQFSVEIPVTSKAYLWADKYRPRKPRFFNRVHTGFEWNKYNQTHYDFDNPPPKIVQGYKFNIFYPDLIDKRSTPEYFLEACHDNRDFAILRFHAGPPYEDIAFKIVNREWEYSHRHGFRCQFSNGIFQLWFHFKRYRYRR